MDEVRALTNQDFREFVNSRPYAVVHFGASWNAELEAALDPVFSELAGKFPAEVAVGVLLSESEGADRLFREFGVDTIPTVVYFRGGLDVEKVVGLEPNLGASARVAELLEGGVRPLDE